MIREGALVAPGNGNTVDVAAGSQFETLGGTLNLTFRAGMTIQPTDAISATYEISLGTNDVAQGALQQLTGDDLPILWQGQMGPGKVFFKILAKGAPIAIADITAT